LTERGECQEAATQFEAAAPKMSGLEEANVPSACSTLLAAHYALAMLPKGIFCYAQCAGICQAFKRYRCLIDPWKANLTDK